jgi:general secretion pathway protein B
MSFILDALKKSENERQRQIGPSLADVRMTRRNAERPWWVVAVAALLVINLGVLIVVLVRDGDATPAPAADAVPAPAPSAQPQSYSAPVQQPRATQSYQPPQAARDPSVRSLADEAGGYEEPYPGEAANPNLAGAAAVPPGPPIVRQIEAPSVAPLPSGAVFEARQAANAPAARASNETLPTLNELSGAGTTLPDLHLDIHVHSQNAAERFVFVNMRKYLEGETLKEGPSVERITSEGVILNQRGLRFLLPRQ